MLEGLGFTYAHGSLKAGDLFHRCRRLLVDLVPIRDDLSPPRTVGELAGIVWPAGLLMPHVVEREGVFVPAPAPAMHRAMRAAVAAFYGVEPRDKDRAALAALATLPA